MHEYLMTQADPYPERDACRRPVRATLWVGAATRRLDRRSGTVAIGQEASNLMKR